jgi:hypothetical protein
MHHSRGVSMRHAFTLWLLTWVINRVTMDEYVSMEVYELEEKSISLMNQARDLLRVR